MAAEREKKKMARYTGPVFVMLGTDDRKFTEESWRDILSAATEPSELWLLDGVDHGLASRSIPEAGFAKYAQRIQGLLRTHSPQCIESDL